MLDNLVDSCRSKVSIKRNYAWRMLCKMSHYLNTEQKRSIFILATQTQKSATHIRTSHRIHDRHIRDAAHKRARAVQHHIAHRRRHLAQPDQPVRAHPEARVLVDEQVPERVAPDRGEQHGRERRELGAHDAVGGLGDVARDAAEREADAAGGGGVPREGGVGVWVLLGSDVEGGAADDDDVGWGLVGWVVSGCGIIWSNV
jgi:hypothetical protein